MTGNGNWSEETWSQCDKTCGFGKKSRSRGCTNPAPTNGGKFCEGTPFVVVPCNEFNCPSKRLLCTFHNYIVKVV